MRIKKLKSVFAGLLASAMVFGAASTASAFQYERKDFLAAVTGAIGLGGTEMVLEMGSIDFANPAAMNDIPVKRYSNLFDVNNLEETFSGITAEGGLAALALFGDSANTAGPNYRAYFTVRKGFLPATTHSSMDSLDAAVSNSGLKYSNGVQGGYVTESIGDRSMEWGMADGIHNQFLDTSQPGEGEYLGLENLADGGMYEMDIYMEGDNNYGFGTDWDYVWDISLHKLDYVLRIGVDQTDLDGDSLFTSAGESMAYVETAAASPVPIPGAVWLLGSGFLAMMSMRRKKA